MINEPRKIVGGKSWSTISHHRKMMAKGIAQTHRAMTNLYYDQKSLEMKLPMFLVGKPPSERFGSRKLALDKGKTIT